MKKFLLIFCIGIMALSVNASVFGADVPLTWNASEKATGYKLYMSLDNGITWNNGRDVGNVTEYVYIDVPETGLVLFRVSAYNDSGETIRSWSGAWYNDTWRPPAQTGGLGVE